LVSGISTWISSVIATCRQNGGYVTTIGGRRRFLPDINRRVVGLRLQAERQAVNTSVQGSAADIFKTAFLKVFRQFEGKESICFKLREV
jgi:DNA polymerase I-like protein with 3'-5' exonuclease and polymerase domains